jgi:hypothetical protein
MQELFPEKMVSSVESAVKPVKVLRCDVLEAEAKSRTCKKGAKCHC